MMQFPTNVPAGPAMRKLSLAEYADFNFFFLDSAKQEQIERQKRREENITERFRLVDETDLNTSPSL